MQKLGILTDAAAHFATVDFPGADRVQVLPLNTLRDPGTTTELFRETLQRMLQRFQHVLVILHSGALSPLVSIGQACVLHDHLSARVRVVDSGTFSLGLGLLVQHAAREAVQPEVDVDEVAIHIRRHAGQIYSLIAIDDFPYLVRRGLLGAAQARIAPWLGFTPVFTLEKGELMLFDKARSLRNLFNIFTEFMQEFEQVVEVAYVYAEDTSLSYIQSLQESAAECASDVRFHRVKLSEEVAQIAPAGAHGLLIIEVDL